MAGHVPIGLHLHLRMLQARAALAWRQGEAGQALMLRRSALEFARTRFGENGSEAASSRLALAETLLLMGHAQPALEELHRAEPVLTRLQLAASPERRQLDGLMLLANSSLDDKKKQ